jgi:gliding motility-associated-like protein
MVIPYTLISQCSTPNPPAGLFCDPNVPNGAPLLCELDCLDGYTATMPPYDAMASQDGQPSPLCDNTANGGQPNNMSWFAFIAGSETIRFEITPFDCAGGQSADGVQAGIYGDCMGDEILYCMSEAQDMTFQIGGPGFVMGRIYYFFIDGFEGSQCMYTVNVLEGEQPFPLPNFTYVSDEYTSGETLCTGGTISTVVRGLGDEEVNYSYTVDPPTNQFPGGIHSETIDSITAWTFDESGTYEICVTVTNGCDVSSANCMTVVTDQLQDEVFDEVTLCLEDLNAYTGPDVQDPNGDGILGWQGNPTFFPGMNTDTITNAQGCTYIQAINVILINPGSRGNAQVYTCIGDFPVIYEGMSFDAPVTGLNMSLDDRSYLGCDSLVSLTISEVLVAGEILIEQCENGEAVLQFVITSQVPDVADSMKVYWTGTMDEVLTNPNMNTPSISVDQSGIYGVDVILSINGNHCMFSFDSENVDLNDLRPSPPAQINWNLAPCEDRNAIVYKVNELEEAGVVYEWSYPSDVASVVDNDADSLVVSWGSSLGGMICVMVTNSCGTSEPSCATVEINQIPEANIDLVSNSCINESIIVTSDGDMDWIYIWDFGDATVSSTNDLNGPGPHEISYPSAGSKEILLVIEDGDCASSNITGSVEINQELDPPVISCISTDESIIFSWEPINGAIDYEATINTANNGMISGNSFIVDGLLPDDEVTLELRALSDLDCAHSPVVTATCTAGCEDIAFSISAPIDTVCANRVEPIELMASGSFGGNNISWEPTLIVDAAGNFYPVSADTGNHVVIASVEVGGCLYTDSLTIYISDFPEWTYELVYPGCEDMGRALIILNPSPSTASHEYRVDGDIVTEDTISVTYHTTLIEAENISGCITAEAIGVPPPIQNSFIIDGPDVVKDNQSITFNIISELRSDFVLDSVVFFGNIDGEICSSDDFNDCSSIQVQPTSSQTYCLEVYFNDGCMERVCKEIERIEVVEVYAPNVFSPNEDGNNDRFILVPNNNSLVFNKYQIYDRWGGLLFNQTDVPAADNTAQWDGKVSGKTVLPGVYLYLVEYVNEDGIKQIKHGSFTVVR